MNNSDLLALRNQGLTYRQIGDQYGLTPNAVRKRLDSAKVNQPKFVDAPVLKDFQQSAAPKRVERSDKIVPEYDGGNEMDRIWKEAEADGERHIEKARQQPKFTCNLPSNRVSCVTFISDQHIAPGTPCDFKRMREDAELIRETDDVHAILGGDGIDGHIKHHSAIINARSTVSDQYNLFEYYLQILKNRLLVVLGGNHEHWVPQTTGLDMLGWICKQNKVCYAPYEARIAVNNGQQYKVAMRHQYTMNSTLNQTHAIKQWLRMGEEEFDIGCIGHHHEAAMEQFIYRGKVCWGCRPGSYQISSAYSSQYGFNSAIPTCPSFLLLPDRRHIIGLHDVRDVPAMLRVFNG